MQVKKFEARTMKEALEMVKTQLGPDAIILSARDNNKSYGLVGQGSVEITAAISEESLRKRQFVETKMHNQDRERFQKTTARNQKSIIEQFVQNHTQKAAPRTANTTTARRYVDIIDDDVMSPENVAQVRIKEAAQKAWETMQEDQPVAKPASMLSQPLKMLKNTLSFDREDSKELLPNTEVIKLKDEISQLKNMIQQYQTLNLAKANTTDVKSQYGINDDLKYVLDRLLAENMEIEEAVDLTLELQKTIPTHKHKNKNLVDGTLAKVIMDRTLICNHNQESKFHYVVGPSGAGKTATLVKMATIKSVQEGKRVALITTDIFKVGAADQLRTFAQILNVPFAVVRNLEDWYKIEPYFKDIDHVFVDTPGFSIKAREEQSTTHALIGQRRNQTVHLVLTAWTRFEDMMGLHEKLNHLSVDDLIVNHLDQCENYGNVYSLMQRLQKPLHSFGLGTRLPEDYEYATKERLLDLILKITRTQNKKEMGL